MDAFVTYLPVLAGIALFLYGMKIMSGSLEKLAGAKLEKPYRRLFPLTQISYDSSQSPAAFI